MSSMAPGAASAAASGEARRERDPRGGTPRRTGRRGARASPHELRIGRAASTADCNSQRHIKLHDHRNEMYKFNTSLGLYKCLYATSLPAVACVVRHAPAPAK